MKVLIQVVSSSSVTHKNETRSINNGFNILVGITEDDTKEIVQKIANKVSALRIFADENNKLNLSLKDVNGKVLSISQFTLYADCKKGNRPSFTNAAKYEKALSLYNHFNTCLKDNSINVVEGFFGEEMIVDITNLGPTTIILDSNEI